MNCTVHDSILKGLVQPVLGSFSINLAALSLKTKSRLDKKFRKLAEAFTKGPFPFHLKVTKLPINSTAGRARLRLALPNPSATRA